MSAVALRRVSHPFGSTECQEERHPTRGAPRTAGRGVAMGAARASSVRPSYSDGRTEGAEGPGGVNRPRPVRGVPALPRLRPTPRGRLLATLSTLALAALLTLMALARWQAPPAPSIDHATTVRAGQSLTDVAREQLPELPAHEAVVALRLANGLSSTQISAGQALLVPTR